MIHRLARTALVVAGFAALSVHAEELRFDTLYRTGGVTKNVGGTNLVVRDVVGDSKPDVVACVGGSAIVMSFDGATYVNSWFSRNVGCSAVAAGDRDGDGANEIFVGTSSGPYYSPNGPSSVYVFDATSYGPELAKVQVSATEPITDVAVANVDGDADLEVVALTSTKFYVLNAATLAVEWSAPYGGHTVAVADIDADGVKEIIVAGSDGHVLNGTTHAYKWGYVGGFGTCMAVGDVDNDGKPEIVGGSVQKQVVIVNGDTLTSTTLPFGAQAITTGDANNDGVSELIIGPDQWGDIEGYNAAGTKLWNIRNPEHGVMGMAVGDPDGDGKNEILWGAGFTSSGSDSLFIANANSQTIEYRGADLDGPFRITVADLDNDGDLEMVLTSGSSESGYDGGLAYVLDYRTHRLIGQLPVPPSFDISQVAIGNVDADPAKEIILAGVDWSDGFIHVFDGVTLAKEWSSPAPVCCSSPQISGNMLIVRNIDGDPVDEIIYATTDKKIQVLNGASAFIQYATPALNGAITDADLADLDGDSVLDLAVATTAGAYVFKTSDWTQRTELTLTALSDRHIAAAPGSFAVNLSGSGLAVYDGSTLAERWNCASGNPSGDLAFVTLGGQLRLASVAGDSSLRFFPAAGSSCPAYDTISQPLGESFMKLQFADLDGDGRAELLTGSSNSASINGIGYASEPRGDADSDGLLTDGDMDSLAAYFYGNRAAVPPAADVNADGAIRPDDLFYLINYRRGTGAAPPQ